MSGIEFKIRQRIIRRFEKVGAISRKTAVPFNEANLDLQEQFWLPYFGGSFITTLKKTVDNHLYYITNYTSDDKHLFQH